MDVVTLDLPLQELSQVHFRDGQVVRGCVRRGKLHVTIPVDASDIMKPSGAQAFVEKWSGKGRLLPDAEVQSDPRLAKLTAKHIR